VKKSVTLTVTIENREIRVSRPSGISGPPTALSPEEQTLAQRIARACGATHRVIHVDPSKAVFVDATPDPEWVALAEERPTPEGSHDPRDDFPF